MPYYRSRSRCVTLNNLDPILQRHFFAKARAKVTVAGYLVIHTKRSVSSGSGVGCYKYLLQVITVGNSSKLCYHGSKRHVLISSCDKAWSITKLRTKFSCFFSFFERWVLHVIKKNFLSCLAFKKKNKF